MDILLVTATAMEMRAVLAGLLPESAPLLSTPQAAAEQGAGCTDVPAVISVGPHTLHTLICGIGPVNAAFALGQRLGLPGASVSNVTASPVSSDQATPRCAGATHSASPFAGVICMGVAGTYDPTVAPVGSVVVASEEIFPEYGVADGNDVSAKALGFAQAQSPDGPVVDRIRLDFKESLGRLGLNWHTFPLAGPAVTVAGCSGTPEQALRIQKRTQGLLENMEGFALALGCLQYSARQTAPTKDDFSSLPFVEIRSISNVAGQRPPQTWDLPAALAALGHAAKNLFL